MYCPPRFAFELVIWGVGQSRHGKLVGGNNDADTKSEPKSKSESDTGGNAKSKPDTEGNAKSESKLDTEGNAKSKPGVKADTEGYIKS